MTDINKMTVLLLMLATIASSQSQENTVPITQIRLEGGIGPHEGNIQVMLEGSSGWFYICDDGFGYPEADLICRDLGFEGADQFTKNNHFGSNTPEWRRSSPEFLKDRLNCSSTNTSYRDCPYGEPRLHDCVATELSGVVCRTASSRCQPDEFPCRNSSVCIPRSQVCDEITQCPVDSDEAMDLCNDVSVTRVRGNTTINIPNAVLGTVQVKYNEEWGTVCDTDTSEKEAKVVCRSIGYGEGWSVAFMRSYLGGNDEGMLTALLESPHCYGNERWLGQCAVAIFSRLLSFCLEGQEEFGVFCYNEGVEIRLVGNDSPNSGRVEMKMGGQWGSVCDSGFDIFDAQVICRMLGYHGDAVAQRGSGQGRGPIWDLRLDCLGGEENVQECRIRILNGTCPMFSTAGVTCSQRSGQVDAELKTLLGNTECGVPEDASNQYLTSLSKVRGGTTPSRFDEPWLVSLRTRKEVGGSIICGGSIISEDYILTAAHCFDVAGRLTVVVRVGDYNADFLEDSEEDFFIDKYWIHELTDQHGLNDNDIALIKIERKYGRGIRFSLRVKPICLPSVTDNYENLSQCTVAGWGRRFFLDEPESRPREAGIDVINDYICEREFGGPSQFTSSMVCIGRVAERVNACKGDSGGPLACPVDGRQTLYGIVSSGAPCLFQGTPDHYVRVAKFVGWILDKVKASQK